MGSNRQIGIVNLKTITTKNIKPVEPHKLEL